MEKELNNWWNKIKDAQKEEQRRLFVSYCLRLIELKKEKKLTEEQAAYQMVGVILLNNLSDYPECDTILNIASTTELPRELSYAQPIGKWDSKTADEIKQKEWEELIIAIEKAKTLLK